MNSKKSIDGVSKVGTNNQHNSVAYKKVSGVTTAIGAAILAIASQNPVFAQTQISQNMIDGIAPMANALANSGDISKEYKLSPSGQDATIVIKYISKNRIGVYDESGKYLHDIELNNGKWYVSSKVASEDTTSQKGTLDEWFDNYYKNQPKDSDIITSDNEASKLKTDRDYIIAPKVGASGVGYEISSNDKKFVGSIGLEDTKLYGAAIVVDGAMAFGSEQNHGVAAKLSAGKDRQSITGTYVYKPQNIDGIIGLSAQELRVNKNFTSKYNESGGTQTDKNYDGENHWVTQEKIGLTGRVNVRKDKENGLKSIGITASYTNANSKELDSIGFNHDDGKIVSIGAIDKRIPKWTRVEIEGSLGWQLGENTTAETSINYGQTTGHYRYSAKQSTNKFGGGVELKHRFNDTFGASGYLKTSSTYKYQAGAGVDIAMGRGVLKIRSEQVEYRNDGRRDNRAMITFSMPLGGNLSKTRIQAPKATAYNTDNLAITARDINNRFEDIDTIHSSRLDERKREVMRVDRTEQIDGVEVDSLGNLKISGYDVTQITSSNLLHARSARSASGVYSVAGGSLIVNSYEFVTKHPNTTDKIIAQTADGGHIEVVISSTSKSISVVSVNKVKTVDNIPDNFVVDSITNRKPGSTIDTAAITVEGVNVPVTAHTTLGILVVNGIEVGSQAIVENGAIISIRIKLGAEYDKNYNGTLDINGVSSSFNITTEESPKISDSPTQINSPNVSSITETSAKVDNRISDADGVRNVVYHLYDSAQVEIASNTSGVFSGLTPNTVYYTATSAETLNKADNTWHTNISIKKDFKTLDQVIAPVTPPTIGAITSQTITLGDPISNIQVNVSGNGNTITAYSLRDAPAGISISSTGLISGTPNAVGNYSVNVVITYQDVNGATSSVDSTFSIKVERVRVAPIPGSPTVSSITQTTATLNHNISDLTGVTNIKYYVNGSEVSNNNLTGLTPNTAYTTYYTFEFNGNSYNSDTTSFNTLNERISISYTSSISINPATITGGSIVLNGVNLHISGANAPQNLETSCSGQFGANCSININSSGDGAISITGLNSATINNIETNGGFFTINFNIGGETGHIDIFLIS